MGFQSDRDELVIKLELKKVLNELSLVQFAALIHEDIATCARKVGWNVLVQPETEPSNRWSLGDACTSIEGLRKTIAEEDKAALTTIADEIDITCLVLGLLARECEVDGQPLEW